MSQPTVQPVQDRAPSPDHDYVVELEGLRGLAALTAVCFHYLTGPAVSHHVVQQFRFLLEVSPFAVDTFFIISGFLIGGILLRHRDSANYYRAFYARRFYRIMPLYYAWIAIYIVLTFVATGWGVEPPPGYSTPVIFGSFILMFQNFVPAVLQSSYLVMPTWTLAVEEQFYLLCPICVRRLSPRRLAYGIIAVILAAPLVRALLFWWMGHDGDSLMLARLDVLAIGVLAAILWRTPARRAQICRYSASLWWLMPAFTAAGALLLHLPSTPTPFGGLISAAFARTMMELACLSLFLLVLARPETRLGTFLRSRPMRHCGRLSYCLYLVHWGVLWMIYRFVLHTQFGRHEWLGFAVAPVAFVLSLLIAEVSWRWLERPLIRRGHRFAY